MPFESRCETRNETFNTNTLGYLLALSLAGSLLWMGRWWVGRLFCSPTDHNFHLTKLNEQALTDEYPIGRRVVERQSWATVSSTATLKSAAWLGFDSPELPTGSWPACRQMQLPSSARTMIYAIQQRQRQVVHCLSLASSKPLMFSVVCQP